MEQKGSILEENMSWLEIGLIVMSFIGLFLLKPIVAGYSIFPTIEKDINRILLYYIAFPFIILMMFVISGGFWKKKYNLEKMVIWTSINVVAIIAVQIIPALFIGVKPQSASLNVTLVFICSAIAEELLYRVFIVAVLQDLILRAFNLDGKITPYVIGIILSIVSAGLFMISHTNYWGDSLAMGITLTTGIVQGILYTMHKNTLVIFIAHIVLNIIAVQSVIAYL
jgi:membrane protease YdiL (CAAX protease family)